LVLKKVESKTFNVEAVKCEHSGRWDVWLCLFWGAAPIPALFLKKEGQKLSISIPFSANTVLDGFPMENGKRFN